MPAKKAFAEESQTNNNDLDPLIDALLGHLPPSGDVFPKELRSLWMHILELSLQLIYPETEASEPEGSA